MSNFKDNSGLEKIKSKMSQEERDELMKKFLEKGGKIDKLKPGMAYNMGSLDKSKKPAYTKEDIAKGVKGNTPRPNYDTYKKGSYHDFDVGGDNPPRWEKQPKNEMGGK